MFDVQVNAVVALVMFSFIILLPSAPNHRAREYCSSKDTRLAIGGFVHRESAI